MFLKKNIIQHQQNIEKLIIDYKLLKKAMNLLYKKRIIKAGGINMEWWKKSVVYQIYVKSFQDSNNDGVGDLQGIISRLDYLKILGVDVLWLTPIFKSPNDDNGYDISDYRSIQSEFGTMSDFEELLDKAHQKDIKIILDLVFNHSRAKKSGGSVAGFTALGRAAFFVVALVEICPEDRLFFPVAEARVFEVRQVKDLLFCLLGQKPEHGDEVGFHRRQRDAVAARHGGSVWATPVHKIVDCYI